MKWLYIPVLMAITTISLIAQKCPVFSTDSVEEVKDLYDVFFSPSGEKGIAFGSFSYSVLFWGDSTYWQRVGNNFLWPDDDLMSGDFLTEDAALMVDRGGYIHVLVFREEGVAWDRERYWDGALYDIDFLGDSSGMVVGANGCVLRTTEFDGASFDTLPSFTSASLFAVDLLDDRTVYAAGDKEVWKSTDFGDQWIQLSMPEQGDFLDVAFFNDQVGVVLAAGGFLYYTENGGMDWEGGYPGRGLTSANDLEIFNDSVIYACGGQNVIFSLDRGRSWIGVPGISGEDKNHSGMAIINSDSAYITGRDGRIYRFHFGTNLPPAQILLSDTVFFSAFYTGLPVGSLEVENDDSVSSLMMGDWSSASWFFIENDTLKNKLALEYTGIDNYDVKGVPVIGRDICGYELAEEFQIRILPFGPIDLLLSNLAVPAGRSTGSLVGTFTTEAYALDSYTYELVEGNNDSDNGSFLIRGDSLLTGEEFEVGTFNSREIRVSATDSRGNAMEKIFILTVTESTGWGDHPGSDRHTVSLYPNPVIDLLMVKGLDQFEYTIIDSRGVILKRSKESSQGIVELKGLATGTYYLRLDDGRKMRILPFVIDR